MDEPIENAYFDWLCARVKTDDSPDYLGLFRILHTCPYLDPSGLDENRVADAKELRDFFLQESSMRANRDWIRQEASIFEVLIAFSEIAAFQFDTSRDKWFWQFITNLRLEDYRRVGIIDEPTIIDILERFVTRTYEPSGDGGLFPLRRPHRDQREVELWYQFCDYVEDNGLLYGLI